MPAPGEDKSKKLPSNGPRRKVISPNPGSSSPSLSSKPTVQDGYSPVNNFNSADVTDHLNKSWRATLDSFHQATTGPTKPEMYKGSEQMAWASKTGSVWGKKGSMSSGSDFLQELKAKSTPPV